MSKLIGYVLPGDDRVRFEDIEDDTLPQLQRLVGGHFDLFKFGTERGDVDAWVHDEGLLIGLPVNHLAAAIVEHESGHRLASPLVGPVVLTCADGPETTALSYALVERFEQYRMFVSEYGILVQVPTS